MVNNNNTVNTHELLTERNKELVAKVEELERKCETYSDWTKVKDEVEDWYAENFPKFHSGYKVIPSHIVRPIKTRKDDGDMFCGMWGPSKAEKSKIGNLKEYIQVLLQELYSETSNSRFWSREHTKELDKRKESEKKNTDLTESLNHWKPRAENAEQKVKELEVEVEELEERVDIEIEMNLKALDKSEEWHKRGLWDQQVRKDKIIFALRLENQDLWKKLDAIEEKKKFKQTRKLLNKVKVKAKEKTKEKINSIKEGRVKFGTYVLEKFEAHVLQMPK